MTKTIIRKVTGSVSAFAMDAGQIFKGTSSPSDNLILFRSSRITEVVIDDESVSLESEQSIMIPAHSKQQTKVAIRFKMISTVSKSGYEEVT